jgi:hypothetical protein
MKTMALAALCAALCLSALGAEEFSACLGQLNDNIPCPYSWGVDGWSIGPDDQYTSQSIIHASLGDWTLDLDDTFVTSRLYGYRLDLLRIAAGRIFSLSRFTLRPTAGLVLQGNYLGETIQNLWHEYVVLYPLVHLPYRESDAALYLGCEADYRAWELPALGLSLRGFADIDLYTGCGANGIMGGLEFLYEGPRFEAEAAAGAHGRFLLPQDLSPLMASGFIAAGLMTWKPVPGLGLSFGIGAFPVGSVTDDPAFKPKEYPVTSQLFFLLTIGKRMPRIREFVLP